VGVSPIHGPQGHYHRGGKSHHSHNHVEGHWGPTMVGGSITSDRDESAHASHSHGDSLEETSPMDVSPINRPPGHKHKGGASHHPHSQANGPLGSTGSVPSSPTMEEERESLGNEHSATSEWESDLSNGEGTEPDLAAAHSWEESGQSFIPINGGNSPGASRETNGGSGRDGQSHGSNIHAQHTTGKHNKHKQTSGSSSSIPPGARSSTGDEGHPHGNPLHSMISFAHQHPHLPSQMTPPNMQHHMTPVHTQHPHIPPPHMSPPHMPSPHPLPLSKPQRRNSI